MQYATPDRTGSGEGTDVARQTVNVVFVHGVSGPPRGWESRLLTAVASVDPQHPRVSTHTVRYDDVFRPESEGSMPLGVDPAIRRRRPVPAQVRAQRREQLTRIVGECDQPDGPRIVPPPVVGEILLRSPIGGMDQARAYRHDDHVAKLVRAKVAEAVAQVPGPRVVIGHSMGSIVTLEALHEHGLNVDLTVTLGSPLGVDPAWRRRWLAPEKFRWTRVGSWINVVNVRDPVPWGQGVSSFYPQAVDVFIRAGMLPFGAGGAHDPSTYLTTQPVPKLMLTGWGARP